MEENFNNKISRLELENFTCFTKAEMDFSSGINVFIGENGTGKTHILKSVYAILRKGWIRDTSEDTTKLRLGTNFMEIFKPKNLDIDRLFSRKIDEGRLSLYFDQSNKKAHGYVFLRNGKDFKIQSTKHSHEEVIKSNLLFIPNHEMLTLFDGFMAAYRRRENAFDGTYFDLAENLSAKPLINGALEEAQILVKEFENEVNIKVFEENGQFYLKFKDGLEVEAPLAAEGLKKLAQMIYLIQNGSLNKDTILFWDEPETNLNPKYIKIVAKFLQVLAKNGVQIFVATHDYYLSHLLSLNAEYRDQTDAPPIKFFSLSKGENGTEIESADTIAWLKNNAIVEEYAHFYDLESQLFANTMKQPEPA
jgi:predicted ATPase